MAKRRLAAQERLKQGLAGQRLGKHKVKETGIDVQLGEDLSESFRALKVCLSFFGLSIPHLILCPIARR
jgi:hypothetical protein